jgi:hypothetical protein
LRSWFGLPFAIVLAACSGAPGPLITDEQIAERNARAAEIAPAIAARGRANWERALASGETVFTIGSGVRNVVTNVELKADVYCVRILATRGSQTHNDFWAHYDLPDETPRSTVCIPYADTPIQNGDARKK